MSSPITPHLRLASVLLASALLSAPTGALAQDACEGISPVAGTDLRAVTVITGTPSRPLLVTSPPGDRERLFIVGQDGEVRIWKRGSAPETTTLFLDIGPLLNTFGNETGLLGLAFDPDFDNTGEFYVNYTETNGFFLNVATVVARYRVSATDPDVADPTEERILRIVQPESNHNAGQLFFDRDGYLVVATGDGGGANDEHGTCGNGQATGNLLGKLLRLDVRGLPGSVAPDCGDVANYQVPADNPFLGDPVTCDEIWAYGLRNPWRSSLDPTDGTLYVADVGQDCWEEINVTPAAEIAGANYGWRQMEGSQCFDPGAATCDPSSTPGPCTPACNDPSLRLPLVDESHAAGSCSITGGEVYRGCKLPDLAGTYFYGDFCGGYVRSFRVEGGSAVDRQDRTEELFGSGGFVSNNTSFGLDAEGEVYIVSRDQEIYKIVPPFDRLEVAGVGVRPEEQFLLGDSGWTWEDVQFNTMIPLAGYRVYRGQPAGEFTCIHNSTGPSWTGDPDLPAPGELFAYLVTALDAGGAETAPGPADKPRALSPAPCP